jgi:hypothetical protein
MDERETPLYGGLEDGRVFRIGDTVRRPAGAWTPTIHALLSHLELQDFPSPRPLGLDDKGRESLSFLPGVCSLRPWPQILLTDDGARQVGALARAYRQAVGAFSPPSPAIWRHGPQDMAPGQIVLHGDFGPYNLIWTGERLTGVIDFELARPGDPLEDAVFAAIRVAHLRPDDLALKAGFDSVPDRRARLRAYAAGYQCALEVLIAEVRAVQAAELERMTRLGGAGLEPWATFLRRGLAAEVRLELAWIDANLGTLT